MVDARGNRIVTEIIKQLTNNGDVMGSSHGDIGKVVNDKIINDVMDKAKKKYGAHSEEYLVAKAHVLLATSTGRFKTGMLGERFVISYNTEHSSKQLTHCINALIDMDSRSVRSLRRR